MLSPFEQLSPVKRLRLNGLARLSPGCRIAAGSVLKEIIIVTELTRYLDETRWGVGDAPAGNDGVIAQKRRALEQAHRTPLNEVQT